MRFGQRRSRRGLSQGATHSSRREALLTDYKMLREDERGYLPIMVGFASAIAVIGGTSVFFLLRGCGVEATASCTRYPPPIYALLPAPTLAISALLVQQSLVATFRGRLMLAIEAELRRETDETYHLGSGSAPVYATYRFLQPLIHEARGAMLWTIMFGLPLILLGGLIYYSGLELAGVGQLCFYVFYGAVLVIFVWASWPVLQGYRSLDSWLAGYWSRAPDGRGTKRDR